MKKSKFSETQIVKILQEAESGQKISDLCRQHGISEPTFYNWRSRYGGMTVSELQRYKSLEEENFRLKQIVAEQQLSISVLKEVNSKKW